MAEPLLEQVIAGGNRYWRPKRSSASLLRCVDGFTVSVVAGHGCYCRPSHGGFDAGTYVDKDFRGPYTAVEVGFPSARPEPWDKWSERAADPDKPTDTVYAYVPVGLVRDLVASHGGEAS